MLHISHKHATSVVDFALQALCFDKCPVLTVNDVIKHGVAGRRDAGIKFSQVFLSFRGKTAQKTPKTLTKFQLVTNFYEVRGFSDQTKMN